MEQIFCEFCEEEIKLSKLKEKNAGILLYSRHVTGYFCDLSCMDSYYSEYMGTTHINIDDESSLSDTRIKIKKDKLFQTGERISK